MALLPDIYQWKVPRCIRLYSMSWQFQHVLVCSCGLLIIHNHRDTHGWAGDCEECNSYYSRDRKGLYRIPSSSTWVPARKLSGRVRWR